jgi:hypothetical protein
MIERQILRRSRHRAALSLLVLAGVAGASLPASAQAPKPPIVTGSGADVHFKRGIELYGEADFTGALIEFRRAYEIDPRFQALYNIGETYFQLQDYANALRTLEKYLSDGGAQVPTGRRDEVQREIDKLRNRVATLDLTTNLPDVEITVDDVLVGKTPFAAPLMLSAGRRRIVASLPNRPLVTQVLELAGGDTKKLALTMPDEPRPTDQRPPPASGPSARVVVPWVITGVLGVGAIVTGSLALASASDTNSKLGTYPNPNPAAASDAISSAHSKTVALGVTTDVLLGATAVAAALSIYLTVTARGPADAQAPRVGFGVPARAVSGGPPGIVLQAGPDRLRITGSF